MTVRTLRIQYQDMPPRYRRKPKTRRKASMIYIRVTDDQKRMFETAAHNAGLDLSGWIRTLSIREARRLAAEEREHG